MATRRACLVLALAALRLPAVADAAAPDLKADVKAAAIIAALEQLAADQQAHREQFKIPAPAELYQTRPALSGPHPRYMFNGGITPAQLRAKLQDPRLARYRADLFAQADRFAGEMPPKPPSIDVEDPMRDYADRLPWMALAYLVSDDATAQRRYLDGIVRYLDTVPAWGVPPRDLPLSQMIYGVGAAYDWLHDIMPAATKTKARDFLVAMARELRRPRLPNENIGPWQWRSQTQWLANHKWYNYSALAMAAAVLWGEDQAASLPHLGDPAFPAAYNPTGLLQQGEPKVWLDEAMEVFFVVEKCFGADGAPIEGYNYNDYGLRAYFDFALIAESLTTCRVPLLNNDWMRNHGAHRLHSLLPDNAGFFTYADSTTRQWSGAVFYRLLAARFRDGVAQLVADLMETNAHRLSGVTDDYDFSLPEYRKVLVAARARGLAAPRMAVVFFEAESMRAPADFGRVAKIGAKGLALSGANPGGIEATVEIPADGLYVLFAKYAVAGGNTRGLRIDGQIPFREASCVGFADTGGWGNGRNQFRLVAVGEDDQAIAAPYLFALTRGRHTFAVENDYGGGINWDWFAFAPAGTGKAQIRAEVGDTDSGLVAPAVTPVRTNWRGIFWYDPSLAPAKLEAQPLFHASDDLGIYTARSSWTDPSATWFGFKCGPASGKTVAALLGVAVNSTSGHVHPDAGNFLFYVGPRPVIPGAQYSTQKLTTNHNVVAIETTTKTGVISLRGQYGEGGEWFANNQRLIRSHPTVLEVRHTPAAHSYLCDLGGVYQSTGYPSYRRSLTYLPSGAVVVVDKIAAAKPQTWHFRLLSRARDLKVNGNVFDFSVGPVPARIVDFSPVAYERTTQREILPAHANPSGDAPFRNTATLIARDTSSAIFAVVIGVNGADQGLTVTADDTRIVISGAPGGTLTLDWKPESRADVPTGPGVRP